MTASLPAGLPSCPLSYPAGSSSWEPYRFRIVGSNASKWIAQLVSAFPHIADFFSPRNLVINAYPATLGLTGFCASVDTYLHPPNFFSALQLAACENCDVVFAAQPLIGADLLYRATCEDVILPKRILFATGGYYFPVSLEDFIRARLSEYGIEVRFLHSYGLAQVGHSLLCATERFSTGEPIFRQVSDYFSLETDESSQLHVVNCDGNKFPTGDRAEKCEESFLIRSNPSRLDPRVKAILESWGLREWSRRTGYLHAGAGGLQVQLRENLRTPEAFETCFHLFWHQFGGSITMKPKWNWHPSV